MKKIISILLIALTMNFVNAQSYTLDRNHTKVGFSAKHFGISNVEGQFTTINASLDSKKEDLSDAKIEMIADVRTIDTDNEMRDKDLKSENWFNADKYPDLTFKSTSFKKIKDKVYKLSGNITIKGVTKPITFDVVYNGKATNPMNKKTMLGFTITGKLNRNDFGVGTGPASKVVGDEIELRSNAEFTMEQSVASH